MPEKPPGLDLYSDKLIIFPHLCSRCGAPTDRHVHVLVAAAPTIGVEIAKALTHTYGHMVDGAMRQETHIPCCTKCRKPRNIAYAIAFLCAALPIIGFCCIPLDYNPTQEPAWLFPLIMAILLLLIVTMATALAIGWKSIRPVIKRLPDGRYHYHFHSGAYVEWAQAQGIQTTPGPQ